MTELTLPKLFIRDRHNRNLSTPTLLRETATHYVIDRDDPALAELITAANAAEATDPGSETGMSARVLIHSLKRQGVDV